MFTLGYDANLLRFGGWYVDSSVSYCQDSVCPFMFTVSSTGKDYSVLESLLDAHQTDVIRCGFKVAELASGLCKHIPCFISLREHLLLFCKVDDCCTHIFVPLLLFSLAMRRQDIFEHGRRPKFRIFQEGDLCAELVRFRQFFFSASTSGPNMSKDC